MKKNLNKILILICILSINISYLNCINLSEETIELFHQLSQKVQKQIPSIIDPNECDALIYFVSSRNNRENKFILTHEDEIIDNLLIEFQQSLEMDLFKTPQDCENPKDHPILIQTTLPTSRIIKFNCTEEHK